MNFFFNDTATTEIYTLSLHDALPICSEFALAAIPFSAARELAFSAKFALRAITDRKSTRLNSSHQIISYAVFCLKKKKNTKQRKARPVGHDVFRSSECALHAHQVHSS